MKTIICKQCAQPFEYDQGCYWFTRYLCPDCDKKRVQEAKAEQEAERQRILRAQWRGICPPLYRDTDPTRLPQSPMRTVLMWKYGPKGLILHGETGRGKTRTAFQLLRRLHFDESRKIVCFGAGDFGVECSKRFFEGDGMDWLQRLVNADVFFLDDLGKDRLTDRVETALFGLVEKRTANLKPIIFTTQHDANTLTARMTADVGPAFVRRIKEFCQGVTF